MIPTPPAVVNGHYHARMATIEKGGGERSVTLYCGHKAKDPGPVFGQHPVAGDLHKCPRCKRVVPVRGRG